MNFKQALVAHLQGEKVECGYKGVMWVDLLDAVEGLELKDVLKNGVSSDYEFRIANRTIICNGVEVPAPENETIESGSSYYLADPGALDFYVVYSWTDHAVNKTHLQRGLVYLNKDDAIARAKAMLIVQEVK